MTGPSTMEHHKELHERIRALEAELAQSEKRAKEIRIGNLTLLRAWEDEKARAEKAQAEVEQLEAEIREHRCVNDKGECI